MDPGTNTRKMNCKSKQAAEREKPGLYPWFTNTEVNRPVYLSVLNF